MYFRWFFLSVVVIFIFLILISVLWLTSQRSQDNPVDNGQIPGQWSKPTANGDCLLYNFAAQEINGIFLPGIPNLSSLSSMTGINVFPSCLDDNQIIAQQLIRTCNADTCLNINGNFVNKNTTETFFSTKNCSNIASCPGTVALLSFNYQVPGQPVSNTFCLDNSDLTMKVCDPTIDTQLMVLLSSRQAKLTIWNNPLGDLFQIVDRVSGNYLDLDLKSSSTSVNFDGNYIIGCSSGITQQIQPVILQQRTAVPNGGFTWLFLAANTFTGNINIPQQIVYVGNLDLTTLSQQTTYDQMINYLTDVEAYILYFAGPGTTNLVGGVTINTFPISTCQIAAFTPQYLSYSQFNFVSKLAGCQGPDETNCLGF